MMIDRENLSRRVEEIVSSLRPDIRVSRDDNERCFIGQRVGR